MLDLETSISSEISLYEKGNEHGPLRMCVNAATGSSLFKSSHEERGALGWFQRLDINLSRVYSCLESITQGNMYYIR